MSNAAPRYSPNWRWRRRERRKPVEIQATPLPEVIEKATQQAQVRPVKDKGELAPGKEPWTRPDEYIGALARRRTARHSRGENRPRTQPETPRFSLSTLPFLVLFGALLLIAVGIMVAAWPGGSSQPKERQIAARQIGTAEKGWFQEAEKQFHR